MQKAAHPVAGPASRWCPGGRSDGAREDAEAFILNVSGPELPEHRLVDGCFRGVLGQMALDLQTAGRRLAGMLRELDDAELTYEDRLRQYGGEMASKKDARDLWTAFDAVKNAGRRENGGHTALSGLRQGSVYAKKSSWDLLPYVIPQRRGAEALSGLPPSIKRPSIFG